MLDDMNPEEEYKDITEEMFESEIGERTKLGKLFSKMKEREKKFHR